MTATRISVAASRAKKIRIVKEIATSACNVRQIAPKRVALDVGKGTKAISRILHHPDEFISHLSCLEFLVYYQIID